MLVKSAKLILIATLLVPIVIAWRNFEIILSNTTCTIFSEKIKRLDCMLKKTPKNITKFTVIFVPAQDVYLRDIYSAADLIRDGTAVRITNNSINACELIEGVANNFGLKLVLDALKEPNKSSLPSKCPFKKNTEYYIKDFLIDAEKYPPYTPHFKFNHTAQFRDNNELLMRSEIIGELKPKVNKKNKSG